MNSKKNPASLWKLYGIIDSAVLKKDDPIEAARALFKNGAGAVQLRYKNYPSYELLGAAKKIQRLADKYGRAFLVNDRLDVALASNASGVHLGSGDMPLATARDLLNERSIIGLTLHSLKDAKKTARAKINYVSAGPVFSTPLKKNLKKRGVRFIKDIKKITPFPLFAIGGINRGNAKIALRSGADGIAVARAIWEAKDLVNHVRELRSLTW